MERTVSLQTRDKGGEDGQLIETSGFGLMCMLVKVGSTLQAGRVVILGNEALCLELLNRNLGAAREEENIPISVAHFV